MNKKMIGVLADIAFLVIVFKITDYLMLEVFKTESIWYELGIYAVVFGLVFGLKAVITRGKRDKNS